MLKALGFNRLKVKCFQLFLLSTANLHLYNMASRSVLGSYRAVLWCTLPLAVGAGVAGALCSKPSSHRDDAEAGRLELMSCRKEEGEGRRLLHGGDDQESGGDVDV